MSSRVDWIAFNSNLLSFSFGQDKTSLVQPNRTNAITVHNKHSFNYILLIKKNFFLSDLKSKRSKEILYCKKPKHNCNFNSCLLRISLSILNKGRSTSKSTQIVTTYRNHEKNVYYTYVHQICCILSTVNWMIYVLKCIHSVKKMINFKAI